MSDHDTYLQLLFTAAANLYGEITMHELWDIYLILKEKGIAREKIHKKDILAFAAEKKSEDTVYDFFEENELYTEEERNPDRLRVINKMLMKEGDFTEVMRCRGSIMPYMTGLGIGKPQMEPLLIWTAIRLHRHIQARC